MRKLFLILLLSITVLGIPTGTAYTQYSDKEPNLENEHFEIKIVQDYPSQGGLEALVNVNEGEKRTMVLHNDLNADLKQRCNTLYGASRHDHPNPCYLLE